MRALGDENDSDSATCWSQAQCVEQTMPHESNTACSGSWLKAIEIDLSFPPFLRKLVGIWSWYSASSVLLPSPTTLSQPELPAESGSCGG